jgi:hypothetical protein
VSLAVTLWLERHVVVCGSFDVIPSSAILIMFRHKSGLQVRLTGVGAGPQRLDLQRRLKL